MTVAAEVRETADRALIVERQGALARVTLNRPRALNALTTEMRSELANAFRGFARVPELYAVVMRSSSPRAFCAGGDLHEFIATARSDPAETARSMAEEYGLSWLLDCFSKPTACLIDGLVMGGGAGISLYATHRVAGARYSFSMPETVIGFFPDEGVAATLARLPDRVGFYLGLTGRAIGRADALALGLVTHCIDAERYGEIERHLIEADPIDPVLDSRHQDPGPAPLAPLRETIARCFSGGTVEAVIARLGEAARKGGAVGGWAEVVLADLAKRSPTSLKVTFRHIGDAGGFDLRQTLIVDYRLATAFLADHDLYEGVRAVLVEKDNAPKWSPSALSEVSESLVQRYFRPLPEGELKLPSREEMQAARV
jgi:enoyl-CoA hydratase